MHINIDTQNKEIRVIEAISESIELKSLMWELENTVMNLEEYSIFIDKQVPIPQWGIGLPDKLWKPDPLAPPWIITGDTAAQGASWPITGENSTLMETDHDSTPNKPK